jgi:hypothetical protein
MFLLEVHNAIISNLCQVFCKKFQGTIAHNVPAVGDVFAARIRDLRSKDQGCKNVGVGWRGNGA